MGWVKLKMRFAGKCMECGKPIPAGQQGMWSRGVGVKHIECLSGDSVSSPSPSAQNRSEYKMACSICGKPAGCEDCEFLNMCDPHSVSPNCLCHSCIQKRDVMKLYKESIHGKLPVTSGFVQSTL